MLTRQNLKPWQAKAAERARTASLGIAAAPGSGKTITALTAISDGLSAGRFRRVALIAPRILLDAVHVCEAARWEHTKHLRFDMAHRLTTDSREHLWFDGAGDIVTITPDTVTKFVMAISERRVAPVDAVFVDESHAFKTPNAVRTKALHKLSEVVPHIVLLSGTFSPNGPIDCWSPGRLTSKAKFWGDNFYAWRAKHFDERHHTWRPKTGATAMIHSALADSAMSIRFDRSDSPAALFSQHPFTHDSAHTKLIATFRSDRKATVSGIDLDGETDGAFLAKFQQLGNGFFYKEDGEPVVLSMARVDALADIIDDVEGPVLVVIKYAADVAMIKRKMPSAVALIGDTAAAKRAQIVADWNSDRIPILLIHPQTGGVGLNLQSGSSTTMVWFTGSFSHTERAQANARLVRTGQTKTVSIIDLVCPGSLDDAIAAVLDRKQSGEKALIDALGVKS